MTQPNQYDDFFDGVGEGGAPSYNWGPVGDVIRGEVVDQYRTVVTDPSGNKKTYSDGSEIPQLNVTIKTDLRNWEKCKKVPTDPETGQPKPPSEDDGTRRIYVKYDMRRAVAVAVKAAGQRSLSNGSILAVKHSGDKPTNKGNPLPLYEARYTYQAPPVDDFADQPSAPQGTPANAGGGWGDEPPF